MNFMEAIQAMKEGKNVKLPEWDGYIYLEGQITMSNNDVPYVFTRMVFESTDWEVVDEKPLAIDFGDPIIIRKESFIQLFPEFIYDNIITVEVAKVDYSTLTSGDLVDLFKVRKHCLSKQRLKEAMIKLEVELESWHDNSTALWVIDWFRKEFNLEVLK